MKSLDHYTWKITDFAEVSYELIRVIKAMLDLKNYHFIVSEKNFNKNPLKRQGQENIINHLNFYIFPVVLSVWSFHQFSEIQG